MYKSISKKGIAVLLAMFMMFSMLPLTASAANNNYEPVTGITVSTNNSSSDSMSNGVITVKAKGSAGFFGIGASARTTTITIYNDSDSIGIISFDYSGKNVNSLKVDGVSYGGNTKTTISKTLESGASIVLVLTTAANDTENILYLENFSLSEAASSNKVSVSFNADLGSVTANANAVTSGDEFDVAIAESISLVATAKSGSTFLGWINTEDNSVLSTNASFSFSPTKNMSVKAIFTNANSEAHFLRGAATQKSQSSGLLGMSKIYYYTVAGNYLYENLASAISGCNSGDTLVLMNNGILSAGDYTIPAGVTMLIPFDSQNTMYTTQAVGVEGFTSPTAYRTLTMADGANLTVNGSVSLSAKHRYAQGSKAEGGSPTGAVSFIKMQGNSKITVNNGGALYAYGYITGSGSVVANSGATVYENFQIMDFRGGTQSTDMDNGVFPLSQYYIQNIEVPLTLYSGAKEYAYTTIFMSKADFGSAVAFISNSKAMFNLTSGYVVKKYDGAKDRLIVESYGDLTVSSIEMEVGTSSINSSKYELPINSNLTVSIRSGSTVTMNQDIAMLPGSEIIIDKGANCKLNNGVSIYLYDADEWGDYSFGVSSKNTPFKPVTYAPGRTYNRTNADLVDAKIEVNGVADASVGYVYTTQGGANICGGDSGVVKIAKGSQTATYQMIQSGTNSNGASVTTQYIPIPITTAQIKNADGSYIKTANATATEYHYTNGKWVCYDETKHTEVIDAAVAPTCTKTGLTEGKHCSACGTVIVAQKVVDALDHDYNDGVVTTDPTCENAGVKTFTCGACGDTYTEAVTATGHKEVIDKAVEPTCTETGLTEGKHCETCGTVIVAQKVVDALDHDYNDGVVTTDPTCENAGVKTFTCGACGDTYTEAVTATGHKEVIDEAVGPTCTETGLTEGKHCETCGTVIVAQEVVDALDHDYNDGVVTTDPTCENAGVKTFTCGACGDTYTEAVTATGHKEVIDKAVEPTCTETGLTEGKHCETCGTVIVAQKVVDALDHDYNDGVVTTDPTCENAGVKTFTCGACGDTYTEAVTATGHKEVIDEAVEPTYTETGLTEGKHCETCGEVLIAQEIIPTKEYTLGDADENDIIDIRDLVALMNDIVNAEDYNIVIDMNKDGVINALDATALKKKLWEIF